MTKLYSYLLMVFLLAQTGCAFLGGTAVGAAGTSAGYEIQAKRQMDQLNKDYENEKISKQEYEARKKEIEKGSIFY